MGIVGSSFSEASLVLGVKSQDISPSVALTLTTLFLICLMQIPQLHASAFLKSLKIQI